MSRVLNLSTLRPSALPELPNLPESLKLTRFERRNSSWSRLQWSLRCSGRFLCLFSNNQREEQARKALESALGEKKNEFEKWNKEIRRREELGGGGDSGKGGGWFGFGGWSSGDHFWHEAQQTSLTVLGIFLVYLIVAKGELILAVIFNPLLHTLRGTRDGFISVTSRILGRRAPEAQTRSDNYWKKEAYGEISAKERVLKKWGGD